MTLLSAVNATRISPREHMRRDGAQSALTTANGALCKHPGRQIMRHIAEPEIQQAGLE
jgi:hypothetical protein